MRLVLAILLVSTAAYADAIESAAIGAGAQGDAAYSAIELRLDAIWPGVRLGLGVRGVWDDATFRTSDWASPWQLVTILRDVELVHALDGGGHLAAAIGALAPAHVGHIADGDRASIDDRWRTGVRAAASTRDLDIDLEIDDVLDPALIGGAVRYAVAPSWNAYASAAIDPTAPSTGGAHVATTFEAGGGRRFESDVARVDVGGSLVVEPTLGASGVAFADAAIGQPDADARWTIRGDARAGTGGPGDAFGPLYRIERLTLWDRARANELDGVTAGVSASRATAANWIEVGVRQRAGLGPLGSISAGASFDAHVQAGLWAAAGTHDGAGAAEVRWAWSKRWFAAIDGARIYQLDMMEPVAVWSAVAWFGAASE